MSHTEVRRELLAHLDTCSPEGGLSEEGFARLGELVERMRTLSPIPDPMRRQDRVEGRWITVFAHFGPRHSAGKPREHDTNLKVQSFNRFPPVPVRVTALYQEIARQGCAYNNVVAIRTPDGRAQADIITYGAYREDQESGNPQRFVVDFTKIAIVPKPGTTEAQLRESLGFGPEQPLQVSFPPPRLWSDVLYLDDEYRINNGSFGGLYVLRRVPESMVSVPAAH